MVICLKEGVQEDAVFMNAEIYKKRERYGTNTEAQTTAYSSVEDALNYCSKEFW